MADTDAASPVIDLDYILVNELGQFGKYQIMSIFLVAFPVIFSAMGAGEYIFSVSNIGHRCVIPECDAPDAEFRPDWLLNAIPGASLTNFDNCNRFVNISAPIVPPTGDTCPANLFNQYQTISCDEYVYERTNSVVYDFGLECQEWLRTLAGTLNSVGTLLVLPITGYISDRYGRRVALTVNAINTGIVGFIRSFSVNYEMYLALQLLQTTIGAGAFSSCFLLSTELVGPKFRVVAGASMSSLFAIGQVCLGLIAWAIPEWRVLSMVLFGPQVLVVFYFWIMSESVRWLLSKGNYEEAKAALLKAAKINRRQITEKSMEALMNPPAQDNAPKQDANEPSLAMRIIKSPVMLRRICTTPVWWVTTTFVYYGLSINAVSLYGNMYVNYILVSAIELPGYWTAVFLLDRIGRKITLCIGYMTCAVCCIAFAFTPDSLPTLSLILYLLGKLAISLVFTSMYIYTAELYPTRHRHTLLAFSSMIGRVGSITAPLTPALMVYWPGIPSIMFGMMALISGILVLTTPETLGSKLPDTIEEAEQLGVR